MSDVSMHLGDHTKAHALGIPPAPSAKRKVVNRFYEAMEIERTGNTKDAEVIYLELLNNDFDNVALLSALGMTYVTVERNGLGFTLLQKALDNVETMIECLKRVGITPKGDPAFSEEAFITMKRSELLNAIGTAHKHENRIDISRDFFERAQALIPLNADIQNNLGTLYINEGNPANAQKHLNDALSVDPNHAQAHWNLSLTMLELGDYVKGWLEYDWGLEAKVRQDRNYHANDIPPLPVWKGENGARVVVYGEQGIGDEIMFASMLPDLMADCELVVFECHRKLHKTFAHSFPTIDIYPTREDNLVTWPILPSGKTRYQFTHKIAIGSLGQFYRNKLADFPGTPYLNPTPQSEALWAEKLAKLPAGPKIGLSWMGGHKKTRVEVRSIELERLLPLLEVGTKAGAQFICLQYTDNEEEIAEFERAHPHIKIHQFPEAAKTAIYDDCAGLVANLDLVITVCTSIVHLSGALGVPCWVMTPSRPAWRYRLDMDTMPWYQHSLLFRQQTGTTEWQPVINDVTEALKALMGDPKCL